MTTQVNTKVRLVKCPKCRKLLAELPDISVYKCGGCGTVLQAKIRKLETDIPSQETVSDVPNHDLTPSPKVGSSSDRSLSGGLSSPRSEDSPPQVEESPKYPLGQQDPDEVKDEECRRVLGGVSNHESPKVESSLDRSFSDELSSLQDVTSPQSEDSSPLQVEESPKYPSGGDPSLSNELSSSSEITHEDEAYVPERVLDNCAPSENDKNGELDHENGVGNDESVLAPGSPLNGSLVSFYLTTDDEHLDHHSNFERISSIDTLRSSPNMNSGHNFPRNGSYYSYDGSESSYDGTNYRIPNHVSHPSRKKSYMRTPDVLRKDSFRRNNHAMKNSHWSQGTPTEANRYNTEHRMRFDNQHRPPRGPAFNLREPNLYSDPEKIDLLRTVYELKDQLNRMQFPSNQHGKFSAFRHDRIAPDHNPVKVSRMAFSGEAAHYRRPCLHYSAQLPSCSMQCCKNSSYNSPSPHHYTSSELSLHGCDSKPETTQRREKYKRHLRPVVGGAPFVSCYHCWEVLQLPVDFVLFNKRYHKLMCNGCRKVLKFSILKDTHVVPYNDASAPPPSEADDFNNAAARNLDPVSYSDDYGREFCSTEEEALGVVPSSEELYRRKMEDRKMKGVLMDSRTPPKFRKYTSEIEEIEPSPTSPLHRLMGYPSPSHVLTR